MQTVPKKRFREFKGPKIRGEGQEAEALFSSANPALFLCPINQIDQITSVIVFLQRFSQFQNLIPVDVPNIVGNYFDAGYFQSQSFSMTSMKPDACIMLSCVPVSNHAVPLPIFSTNSCRRFR